MARPVELLSDQTLEQLGVEFGPVEGLTLSDDELLKSGVVFDPSIPAQYAETPLPSPPARPSFAGALVREVAKAPVRGIATAIEGVERGIATATAPVSSRLERIETPIADYIRDLANADDANRVADMARLGPGINTGIDLGGQLVPVLAAAILPGAQVTVPGLLAAQGFTLGSEEAEAAGATPEQREKQALAGAALNAALAYVPVKITAGQAAKLPVIGEKLSKFLTGGTPKARFVANTLIGGVATGATEGVQTALMNLSAADWAGFDPERGVSDNTLAATGVGTGVGSLLTAGMQALMGRKGRALFNVDEKTLNDALARQIELNKPFAPGEHPVETDPRYRFHKQLADKYAESDPELAAQHAGKAAKRKTELEVAINHERFVEELRKLKVEPPSLGRQLRTTTEFEQKLAQHTTPLDVQQIEQIAQGVSPSEGAILGRIARGMREQGIARMSPAALRNSIRQYTLPLDFDWKSDTFGESEILVRSSLDFATAQSPVRGLFAVVRGRVKADKSGRKSFVLEDLESPLFSNTLEDYKGKIGDPASQETLAKIEAEAPFLDLYRQNWRAYAVRALLRNLAERGIRRIELLPEADARFDRAVDNTLKTELDGKLAPDRVKGGIVGEIPPEFATKFVEPFPSSVEGGLIGKGAKTGKPLPVRRALDVGSATRRIQPRSTVDLDFSKRAVELENTIKDVSSRWKGAPPIHVFKTFHDARAFAARRGVERVAVDEGVVGFHLGGEIALVAEKIPDRRALESVLAHEVFRHYGLRRALGPTFEAVLKEIHDRNPSIQQKVRELPRSYNFGDNVALAVDEVLARMGTESFEQVRGLGLAAYHIRRLLGKLLPGRKWSDEDIVELLREGRKAVEEGTGRPVAGVSPQFSRGLKLIRMSDEPMLPQLEPIDRIVQEIENTPTLKRFNSFVRSTAGIEQMAARYQNLVPLQDYRRLTRQQDAYRSGWALSVDNRITELKAVGADSLNKVFGFALDMTYASSKAGRRFTDEELARMSRGEQVEVNGKRFGSDQALNEAQFKIYQEIDADFRKALADIKSIMDDMARRKFADPKDEAFLLLELKRNEDMHRELLNRNYFPLSRFGDFYVTVRAKEKMVLDGEEVEAGEVVWTEFFESKGAREKGVRRVKTDFPSGRFEVRVGKQVESPLRSVGGFVPARLEARLLKELSLSEEQSQLLKQILIDMQPARAFAKRMKKRLATKGYSEDGMRAYADYFLRFSHHVANMKFGPLLDDAINQLDQARGRLADNDVVSDVVSWLRRHRGYMLDPTSEWTTIKSLVTIWNLGFSPRAAWVNLTQVPLIVYPYLAKKYGTLATGVAGKYTDLFKVHQAIENASKRSGRTIATSDDLPDGMGEVLKALVERRVLDQGLAVHLASFAEGLESTKRALTGGGVERLGYIGAGKERVRRGMHRFSNAAMWIFQGVEKINRRVTAMAAFDLELKTRGKKWAELTEAERAALTDNVEAAVRDTNFEYGRYNRPEILRGKKGAAFVFRSYTLNALYFIMQQPGGALYFLGSLAVGGLLGLPFMEDALDLVDSLLAEPHFRKFARAQNLPPDARSLAREYVRSLVEDSDTVDTVMQGAGHLYGLGPLHLLSVLGAPIPHVSVSSSFSQGNIVPGTETIRAAALGADRGKVLETAVQDLAGATGSMFLQWLGAATSSDEAALRWQRLAPAEWRRILKSMDAVKKSGFENYDFSMAQKLDMTRPTDMMAAILNAGGFKPSDLENVQAKDFALREGAMFWRTRRQAKLDRYARAFFDKDSDSLKEALAGIESFNRFAPPKFRLGADTIRRSIGQRQRKQAFYEVTGYRPTDDPGVAAEYMETYGVDPAEAAASSPE